MVLRVFRWTPGGGERLQAYEIAPREGLTVLDALVEIQRRAERERAAEQRAVPAHGQAEVQQQRADAEQRVQKHEGEQRRLHRPDEGIVEVERADPEQRDRGGALHEPRPHAGSRAAPALSRGPLAPENDPLVRLHRSLPRARARL